MPSSLVYVETAEAEQNLALIIGRLEDFSDKVHQALDALDWHGTRDIIRMMIRQIEVDGDHVESSSACHPLCQREMNTALSG